MTKTIYTPDLSCLESIFELPVRRSPYWNTLEYCRHIGVEKLHSAKCHWMARIRRIDGKYSQKRIGNVAQIHKSGLDYNQALTLSKVWFDQPDIKAIASQP